MIRDLDEKLSYYLRLQGANRIRQGSLLETLVLFLKWLSADMCWIRDIYAELVPLHLNLAQKVFFVRMLDQAAEGKPVRIVVLKARKVGISTVIQALYFFLCAHYKLRIAVTVAHEAKATTKIFDIAKIISENYKFKNSDPSRNELTFTDNRSQYYCYTAGGKGVGAGDTPLYLHFSEVALWSAQGIQTDYTAANAVPDTNPDTIIVYESTARGRDVVFWPKFEDARQGKSVYRDVFVPWYYDNRLRVPIRPDFIPDEDELDIVAQAKSEGINLTFHALQWRRDKINAIGPDIFRQEYPSTPEEAVQATKGLIFPRIRRHIIDKLPFNPDLVPYGQRKGGIDWGYYDPTVIVTAFYVDQVIYVTKIYRASEKLASDHATHIEEGHTYYVDPAEVSGREELKKAVAKCRVNAKIVQAPRRKKTGDRTFVKGEIYTVQDLLRHDKIKILRGCEEQLLMETDNYCFDPRSGEPNEKRSPDVGHYDTVKALMYLVMGVVHTATRKKIEMPYDPMKVGVSRKMALRSY